MHCLPPLTLEDQRSVYAWSGEDGIIEKIFAHIPPRTRTYVEIGIGPDMEERARGRFVLQGNTVLLHEKGWRGWWFDGVRSHEKIIEVFVTPLNINSILRGNGVPAEVDLFSLDIDGQDFWVFLALQCRPLVFCVEINPSFTDARTVEWNPRAVWHRDNYYGASLAAFNAAAIDKGYVLVFYNGANAFFVRRDVLANPHDHAFERIAIESAGYHHPPCPAERVWVDVVEGPGHD